MEHKTLFPNTEFLRDGEQDEFGQVPMVDAVVPTPPTPIRFGSGVRIGAGVKVQQTDT